MAETETPKKLKPGIPVEKLGRMVRSMPPVAMSRKRSAKEMAELEKAAARAKPGPTLSKTAANLLAEGAGLPKGWFDDQHKAGAFQTAEQVGSGWKFSEQEVKAAIADALIEAKKAGGK